MWGAGLIGAVDVVLRGRTPIGTTAWAIALLVMPPLAVPFYLVFGNRRFEGYVRARRDGVRQIDEAAAALAQELEAHRRPPVGPDADFGAVARLARMPFVGGNRTRLLIDGKETYAAIFRAIDEAKQYVLVQYYIVRADAVGNELAARLIAARRRGVRVMFLYDEIGCYNLPTAYVEGLRREGCQCSGFRTKQRRQGHLRLNFRNHRKIVVVDGCRAYTGGVNVGEEYLGHDKKLSPWRDTHIEIEGPATLCLQLSFLEDWYWAQRRLPELRWNAHVPEGGETGVLIVPGGPADSVESCELLFTHVANSARRRLWFATPYFVPDEPMINAMQLAALRGVDVRLIVPEKNDNAMVHWSMLSNLEDLFKVGIKVYRFTPGFMHQKVTLADNVTIVSTANLDNRSFRINFEVSAVVADAAMAAQAEEMLMADMAHSTQVGREWLNALPRNQYFLSRLCRLFSPIQ